MASNDAAKSSGDTSALMAILLDEPLAGACQAALIGSETLLISAATAVEARIVAITQELADAA